MIIKILKKEDYIGRVYIDDNIVEVLEDPSDEISSVLKKANESGITGIKDIEVKLGKRVIVEYFLTKDEPGFVANIPYWFTKLGFEIENDHENVDRDIEEILKDKKYSGVKEQVNRALKDANYLEKTYILEKLKGN